METLLLNHGECLKILKTIKHNKIHKKAIKKYGRCFYIKDGKRYMLEDRKILRKRLGGK